MGDILDGRVCVVTGGGAGIGEATCVRFAEENAHVTVVDVNGDDAVETAERIAEIGEGDAIAVECDVSDETDVEAMAESVGERFESVDVLVNNAGVRAERQPVTEADEESWDRIIGVNVKGVAFCSKHLIPLMDDGSGGSIVNVASIGAEKARPNWSQYDTTKGAVVAMSRDMASDHAEQGIRVNSISPGHSITDYHLGDRTGDEAQSYVDRKTTQGEYDYGILQRAAKPREIAEPILFLASDMSSFVTASDLHVDGGSFRTRG